MSEITRKPLDIPNDYLQAIGLVTIKWSWLEYYIDEALCVIAELKTHDGLSIFTHLQSEIKLTTLASMIEYKVNDKELKAGWKDIIKEIRRLRGKRNLVIHSLWGYAVTVKGPATINAGTDLSKFPKKVVGRSFNARKTILQHKEIYTSSETIKKLATELGILGKSLETLIYNTQKTCGLHSTVDIDSHHPGILSVDVPL